jgi:hypothetical protein
MIVDWYVISNPGLAGYNPRTIKGYDKVSEKFLKKVVETATPLMDYFCNRLTDVVSGELKISQIETVFAEIIEEMPVMNYRISKDNEFIIQYSKYTEIRLTDSTKQIYRDIKLTKILA